MIELPPPSFRLTPYGEVDAAGLDRFRQHFDTSQLLQLVDRLDRCLVGIGGMTALRDELLRLHAMSMTLVEGVAPTVATENTSIWSEAEALQQDLDCLAVWIRMALAAILPLVELAPDYERDV
ncbi:MULTISPECIES: Tn3 family transposase post-transcriptional regulator TnpC [Stutzerimonas stutzeri group]|jgi:hypothetical protein|uniref:Tn3 family transposase post-transcriptional regulator TnpC n=1 Tax=Stutzerimonas stutzeri group TaxID=136846 RepID=UPI000D0B32D4|nr:MULTISPECIES: Tn3 family transposase post-transcriptional regulator TnpC [Pseudomonadaceae]AWL01677.1 transposase [Stutzerimonas stutzeri]MCF6759022.1 transposase [Stutzerimonas balearica]MDM9652289.1 Tn3 family transposase post-transcriptional regulator TnpC [Pseudomonas wenzhouensis]